MALDPPLSSANTPSLLCLKLSLHKCPPFHFETLPASWLRLGSAQPHLKGELLSLLACFPFVNTWHTRQTLGFAATCGYLVSIMSKATDAKRMTSAKCKLAVQENNGGAGVTLAGLPERIL